MIASNSNIQKDICSVLDCKDFKLIRENTYNNDITADFTLFEKNAVGCFTSVLVFPESVLKNNDFNVGLFKYPKSKKILEINSHNLAVRHINDNELEKLRETKHKDFKVISPYYVRDIRFFEVYFLLQVLAIFKGFF
ncbi:hypothetical protein [Helicobacter pylori]|uniref:hypothetical protein n=1 Tax=Helicobacter pylori TaxID=210 RepID=UPI001F3AAADF|nr:hypothetical protein [Helicobacter pylori]